MRFIGGFGRIEGGVGAFDGCLGRNDLGVSRLAALLGIGKRSLGRCQGGLRLFQLLRVDAVVYPGNQVAFFDPLIVLKQALLQYSRRAAG